MKERAIYLAAAVAQRAIPFALLPVFVRVLSPSEYGQVAVLTAIFTFFSMTLGLGQEITEYKYYFSPEESGRKVLRSANSLHLFSPLLGATAVSTVAVVRGVDILGVSPLLVAGSVMGAGFMVAGWGYPSVKLRCERRLGAYVGVLVGYSALASLLKVVLVTTLDLGAAAWPLGDVLASVVLFLSTRHVHERMDVAAFGAALRASGSSLRLGLPIAVSQAARWASSFADRLLIVGLVGAGAGGRYMVATQLVSVGALFVLELSKYLQPEIARRKGVDEAVLGLLPRHLLGIGLSSGAALILSLILIEIGFVGTYTGISGLVVVLSLATFLSGLSYLAADICGIVLGRTKYVAAISILSGAAAIAFALFLIPVLGVVGGAMASVAAQMLTAVALWSRVLVSGKSARRLIPLLLISTLATSTIVAVAFVGVT